MRRRQFIAALGAGVMCPIAGFAQHPAKSYRVGYLSLHSGPDSVDVKQRLNELGYSEGKNLIFNHRSADGRPERLPDLAADVIRTNPDVLIAGFGTLAARAA